MGAGCYYTYQSTVQGDRERAYWVEYPSYPEEDAYLAYQETIEDIEEALETSTYELLASEDRKWVDSNQKAYFENSLYLLTLEETYNSQGLIVRLVPKYDSPQYWNFLPQHYKQLATRLKKHGLSLRIATSGYTSGEY